MIRMMIRTILNESRLIKLDSFVNNHVWTLSSFDCISVYEQSQWIVVLLIIDTVRYGFRSLWLFEFLISHNYAEMVSRLESTALQSDSIVVRASGSAYLSQGTELETTLSSDKTTHSQELMRWAYQDENSIVTFRLRASSYTCLIKAQSSFRVASFLDVIRCFDLYQVWILISQSRGTCPWTENSDSLEWSSIDRSIPTWSSHFCE